MATSIGQIPYRMKGQTTCIQHKGKQLDLYCQKCNTLVCVKCLLTIHKGHGICELSEATRKTTQDITNFIDKIEQNDMVQLRNCISSADTLLKDNNSNFEKLSNKLKMQTDQLKQELDMLATQTLFLYHKMVEHNTKLIQTYKQDLEIYNTQLKQRIQECKTALQRGSHIEIYDTGCEIYSQISLPVKPVLATTSFTPNINHQHHLELALGKITITSGQGQISTDQVGSVRTSGSQELSSTPQQLEHKGTKAVAMYKLLPDTKLVEKWMSPCNIDSICPTTDGKAWTCCSYCDTLTLLDRRGNMIKEVKHKANINNISLSPTTQTLWVSDVNNNILELVSGLLRRRRLTQRFSTNEEPMCICVTASTHVIVGMAKHISKFTTQGQIILTTRAAETGKPLVCTPYMISECPVTHNIAVVDLNYEGDGGDGKPRVVVMDSNFKEQFVYGGEIPSTCKQASENGDKPFNPWDVVYDSVGNILIGDWNNPRALLISGRGEFLRILHTGTYCTRALGVDREDVMWEHLVRGMLKYYSTAVCDSCDKTSVPGI